MPKYRTLKTISYCNVYVSINQMKPCLKSILIILIIVFAVIQDIFLYSSSGAYIYSWSVVKHRYFDVIRG